MAKQKYDFDLIVIGSGAGGGVAADIVARAGKRVAIIEADALGGECPNYGCVPSKALLHAANIYDSTRDAKKFGLRLAAMGYNYPSIKAWKDQAIKRTGTQSIEKYYRALGIRLFQGTAHFLSPHEITVNRRHLSSESFLIATGSRVEIPHIAGIENVQYLTSRSAMDITRPPKSIFIIGGGATGCEFAELFSTFGAKVTIADIAPRLLPHEDEETSATLESFMRNERGVGVLTKAKVIAVGNDGPMIKVTYLRGGEQHVVKAEKILITTNKVPHTDLGLENAGVEYSHRGIEVNEHLQTTAAHIYAAGDVLGHYMYTHVGVYESRVVANNLLRKQKVSPDYSAVPRVTFTTPEIASVGMSESDCLRRDLEIKKAIAPFNMVSCSNITDIRDGFCKIITDRNGTILGATVVGPHAGEIIHELTLAVQYGLTASDVASTLHAFPSWSEIVRVACSKIKV
jgi:pyruvate/2-oxoglutarate dehydrogenase complex dihydrolipoamide dehydrogenase (E3) component